MSRDSRIRALQRQSARLERRMAPLRQQSERLGWLRVVLFFGGLLLAVTLFYTEGARPAGAALAVAALLFAGGVAWHRRVDGALRRLALWQQIKQEQGARAALEWTALPPPRRPAADAAHPFARDLDLAGPRSLHHLLDTTTTEEGSALLYEWLSAPRPDPAATMARQPLVQALVPLHALRDRVTLVSRLAATEEQGWRYTRLLEWLREAVPLAPLLRRTLILSALSAISAPLVVGWLLGWLPSLWTAPLGLYAVLFFLWVSDLGDPFHEAVNLRAATHRLAAVARLLEQRPLAAVPGLRQWLAPFHEPGERPSRFLRRLTWLTTLLSVRQNPFLWMVLNTLLPWDFWSALAMARYKGSLARRLPRWFERWFELEALSALASYGWLHPECAFPTLSDAPTQPPFRAQALGHPLVPHQARQSNDFALAVLGEVALLTGSNMSGKSTFLRTVGINLALAYAGGPVVAHALEARFLRLFSALQITDSLADHVSYFYAEVRRLRALLDALEAGGAGATLPLCFLIDEIFRGTNNRERLMGSRSFLRALVGKAGVGLVSTHDLELVQLSDALSALHNYHFREQIVGGEMRFDYTLRPGPSPTTNALEVMRLAGLPVDEG